MSYVLDMQEWAMDGLSHEEISSALEGMLDFLDTAKIRGEDVWVGRHIYTSKVYFEKTLWELFDRDLAVGLSPELIQEFSGHFNRTKHYDDFEDSWPKGFADMGNVSVDGAPSVDNLDVLWAFSLTNSRDACACVGLGKERVQQVISADKAVNLHWVWGEKSRAAFWRDALTINGDSVDQLRKLAPHAYPDLYFAEKVWRGCERLSGGYHAHSSELQRYLATLNDFGYWVFKGAPPDIDHPVKALYGRELPSAQLIERRFTHLNLNVSPENPNVEADAACKKSRTVDVDGEPLYCQWHGKLLLWINRIHIHGPVSQSENKVVIGVVADHLPLPGD